MLPSSKRLNIALFNSVLDKGRIFHSQFFLLRVIKTQGQSRFSVSVPKKVAKSAVERNKIRRRTYSAIRSIYERILPGFHGVLIAKNTILKASLPEIIYDLDSVFVKTGLLK